MKNYTTGTIIQAAVMLLVVLIFSLASTASGEIVPLPSSFEQPLPSSCHGKTFFLHDRETRSCMFRDEIPQELSSSQNLVGDSWKVVPRGGFGLSSLIPAGYNPFGYCLTELGEKFLSFDGSLDSDVGRFLASVKSRKRFEAIKSQWVEILRVSKTGQSMRIYRQLDDFIAFCLKAGFLD